MPWSVKLRWAGGVLTESGAQGAQLCSFDCTAGHLGPKWTVGQLLIGSWWNYLVRKIYGYPSGGKTTPMLNNVIICGLDSILSHPVSMKSVYFGSWTISLRGLGCWTQISDTGRQTPHQGGYASWGGGLDWAQHLGSFLNTEDSLIGFWHNESCPVAGGHIHGIRMFFAGRDGDGSRVSPLSVEE